MRQALLNHGWHEDEPDFLMDTGIYFKHIGNRKYYMLLQYNTKERLLTVTIRCRANNYQKSTMITIEFLRDYFPHAINILKDAIKTLPTITNEENIDLI